MLEYVGTKRKGQHEKNNSTTCGNKPESTGERRKIKVISTKGKKYKQNRILQNNERKFYQNCEEMTGKRTNNLMQEKPDDFALKYGNQKNISEKPNG